MNKISFAFFGTDSFAVTVLEQLKKHALIPSLIITVPDKPQGKKQIITPPPVKVWAEKHAVEVLQPEKLNEDFSSKLKAKSLNLYIVASYGKIIPKNILDIPTYKTLNIHPSLLPKYRGPSPLEYAILHEKETGVTIMRLDTEMDHGPIIAQEKSPLVLPIQRNELEHNLAQQGADLLAFILPKWIDGTLTEQEQNHSKASYTQKIQKTDGLIDIQKPLEAYKKILAFEGWPTAYFFVKHNNKKIRVIVSQASFEDGNLLIHKVIPEGKKEMLYSDFVRGVSHN